MHSVQEIREKMKACSIEELPTFLSELSEDGRKGVQGVIAAGQRRLEAEEKETKRLAQMLLYENSMYEKGYNMIAGVDEAGRGPLAGPVVAAAVILPKGVVIPGVDDSKKLSAKKREVLYDQILKTAVSYGVGVVSSEVIDEINILQATYQAMQTAVAALSPSADYILADAVTIPKMGIPQRGIVQGDSKSLSIAAASIIAKVTRDRMMLSYHDLYPEYGFDQHKGYGSFLHRTILEKLGPCPIHRRSFLGKLLGEKPDGKNRAVGTRGEQIAAREMKRHGYTILCHNFCGERGEIDIIAQKDAIIVFTEVKYRTGTGKGLPAEAVHPAKQKRIAAAAREYLAKKGLDVPCRFDVAEVLYQDGRLWFHYIENAFWE